MKYLDGVVTLKLDHSKCINCYKCITVCPRNVFINTDQLVIRNLDNCIECGACQMNCPTDALAVDQGVGCFSAIAADCFKKSKLLSKFFSDRCC